MNLYFTRQRQLSRRLAALIAILGLFYAKEAWVSGSHYVRFLEPKFIYEYDDGRRKRFATDEDATSYFAEAMQRSRQAFTAALPRFAQFFTEAAQHGLDLGELRLGALNRTTLGGEPLHSLEQLLAPTSDVYPRLIKLDLNAAAVGTSELNHFVILLNKPLDRQQTSWLWTQAGELQFAKLAARASAMAAVPPEVIKQFTPGLSVVRLGKNFALSVGLTDQLRRENTAAVRAQAEALATALLPQLQKALQNKELLNTFFTGDPKQLIAVAEKLGKHPDDAALAPLFNPYGPLLDSLGMRTTAQIGALHVTLLFVVKGSWGARPTDPQPTAALTEWLGRTGDPLAGKAARPPH